MTLPPLQCGEREAFYRILGPMELAAAIRYTTGCRVLTKIHEELWSAARPLPEAPPRARGAGDLGPAKAESPALCGCLRAVTLHVTVLGSCALHLLPSPVLHRVCVVASCADVVLLRQGRLGRYAMSAAARFVGSSLQVFRQKPLHPCGDQATAEPDRGGNVRDRHDLGDEENNSAPSGVP